jgi:hypothetical protein
MINRLTNLEAIGATSRRDCLKQLGLAGASLATLGVLAGCAGNGSNGATSTGTGDTGTVESLDAGIINAAAIAEALATVMYYNSHQERHLQRPEW